MIDAEDVYWDMAWGDRYPDKPPVERVFEAEMALARLIGEKVVFLNNHWWEKSWPERAQKLTSLNVNCSDIFASACADAEELEYNDIQDLYDMWRMNRTWGPAKWCAIKRNQQPQPSVIEAMKKAGVWDAAMENLGKNFQDSEAKAVFASLKTPTDNETAV